MANNFINKIKEGVILLLELFFPQKRNTEPKKKLTIKELEKLIEPKISDKDPDIRTLLDYKEPLVRQAIFEIKYRGNTNIADSISSIIYSEIIEQIGEAYMFDNISRALLMPIPLSKKRYRKRGFNQSALMVQKIKHKDRLNILEADFKNLYRNKETPPQGKVKNKKERERNLKGVFEVKSTEKVKNRFIILVDDVVTTGSTMKETKKALLKAGARQVLCIGIARS